MLGVHGLAYSIIGGLGTNLGPLIEVFIDIDLLESVRFLSEINDTYIWWFSWQLF